jgi:glutathione S-transferase
MLRIYHVTGTRGMRVIWLCEEAGVDYDVTKIDFSMEYRATAEWRELSPVGKVPILVDDEMIMFESGAMVQYVIDKYTDRSLVPAVDDSEYAHYLQWLWFAEATLARPLGEIVNHGREFPGDRRIPAVTTEMANRAATCLNAVAEHMQDREYLVCGRFTAADIMMGYSILIAEALIPAQMPVDLAPYWDRLQARPAFATARAI